MRICAAADIHYPREDPERCAAVARAMCDSGADVLVLAGDVAVGEEKHYRKLLTHFAGFPGPRLFVPGNHDLWSTSRHPDTPRRYGRSLRSIVEKGGFHYLPAGPLCVDDIGFVGVAGWYDYAFRQTRSPLLDLKVTPLQVRPGRAGARIETLDDRMDVPWEELTDNDYAAKGLLWFEEGRPKRVVWNDAVHADWGRPDAEVARDMAQGITKAAAEIVGRVRAWVGVCHFVPFAELVAPDTESVEAAYCRAFAGSPLLGEAFLADDRCRLVLCGHHHEPSAVSVGPLTAINCTLRAGEAEPVVVTVPADA